MQDTTILQAAADTAADVATSKEQAAEIAQDIQAYIDDADARFDGLDDTLQTQGKTGKRLPRINMAFSEANYDFIKVMAGLEGITMTSYLNQIIDAHRNDEGNNEPYVMAKKLQAMVRSKTAK